LKEQIEEPSEFSALPNSAPFENKTLLSLRARGLKLSALNASLFLLLWSGTVCLGRFFSLLLISSCFKTILRKLFSGVGLSIWSYAALQHTDQPASVLKWPIPSALPVSKTEPMLGIERSPAGLQIPAQVLVTAQHMQLPPLKESNSGLLLMYTLSKYH